MVPTRKGSPPCPGWVTEADGAVEMVVWEGWVGIYGSVGSGGAACASQGIAAARRDEDLLLRQSEIVQIGVVHQAVEGGGIPNGAADGELQRLQLRQRDD